MRNAKVQSNTKLCVFAFDFFNLLIFNPLYHLTPTTRYRVSIFLVHNELNLFTLHILNALYSDRRGG